jgi:hypothetical protein
MGACRGGRLALLLRNKCSREYMPVCLTLRASHTTRANQQWAGHTDVLPRSNVMDAAWEIGLGLGLVIAGGGFLLLFLAATVFIWASEKMKRPS